MDGLLDRESEWSGRRGRKEEKGRWFERRGEREALGGRRGQEGIIGEGEMRVCEYKFTSKN